MEKDFKFINQKDIYQYKFYMIPKELFVIIKILIKLIRIIAIMNKDNIQKNFLIAYMLIL